MKREIWEAIVIPTVHKVSNVYGHGLMYDVYGFDGALFGGEGSSFQTTFSKCYYSEAAYMERTS